MIQQVIYISRAAPGVDERVAQAILAASRISNWRSDITGLLLFSGTYFVQVLEGRAPSIESLMLKISKDPRHADIKQLLDRQSKLRRYGDWAMGYVFRSEITEPLHSLAMDPNVSVQEAENFAGLLRPDSVMGAL